MNTAFAGFLVVCGCSREMQQRAPNWHQDLPFEVLFCCRSGRGSNKCAGTKWCQWLPFPSALAIGAAHVLRPNSTNGLDAERSCADFDSLALISEPPKTHILINSLSIAP
jgi:hypothetical protein